MNIGIDIRALSNRKLTGIGKYIYNAIENLIRIDDKNKYFLFSAGLDRDVYRHVDFASDNLKHIHLNIPSKILNLHLSTGWGPDFCKKYFDQIDLYWMPNINFCRLPENKKMILTVHDLSFLHSREFYSWKRRRWHRMVKVGELVKKAKKIIAVSENTKRDILRFFPQEQEKIQVINPGLDFVLVEGEKARAVAAKYNLPAKFFIYVGTLEPRKNINSIIKAFDYFHKDKPEYHLVIVGGRGWVYRNILKNINKRDFVHYLDYVASPDKDALYKASQGLIWPSFYEGFGFPPMEAIAHNIPLILSYKTSIPETAKQQALYVDPYNVSDIYQALKRLTEDDILLKQFKTGAANFALPTWPEQAKKILELFNSFDKK